MSTKVKICGICDEKPVDILNQMLPDYVGFVFAEGRRKIDVKDASKISNLLDPRIKKVGVFVDFQKELVKKIADECGLDVLQFHGNESAEYCKEFKQITWKVFGVSGPEVLPRMDEYTTDAILLDSVSEGVCGGTGKVFDWDTVKDLGLKKKIILAGGLNIENVKRAIEIVKPFCVDVSSGVETNGIKDADKIREFIERVRR